VVLAHEGSGAAPGEVGLAEAAVSIGATTSGSMCAGACRRRRRRKRKNARAARMPRPAMTAMTAPAITPPEGLFLFGVLGGVESGVEVLGGVFV
jgi:hypothetical protein